MNKFERTIIYFFNDSKYKKIAAIDQKIEQNILDA